MSLWLQELAFALLIIAAAGALSWLSRFLLTYITVRLVGRTATQLDDVIMRAARFPLQAVILVGGMEIAIAQLSYVPVQWQAEIHRLFFVIYVFLVFAFLYRLVGGLAHWYSREVMHRTQTELDERFLDLFRHIALLILTISVSIIILGRFGVEVSALVATLGIGSLAIALAAQETLGNMIAGFTILLDRPFRVGDRIEIRDIDTWGDIVDIGLRSTRILTRDNRLVTVPNSIIGKGLVVNYSVPDSMYRVETHVGVAYGTDVEVARRVMIDAIRAQDWVMKDKLVEALLLEFGDSALIFRVRCWIEHFIETRRIMDKMNTTLYKALNEAGIVIPFPQRDLHLVSSVTPEVRVNLENGRPSRDA